MDVRSAHFHVTPGAGADPAASGAGRPLVSVVIICYNHGRFLAQAIQSVLSQGCRDFEVILVDDGSTDDTAEVAARFSAVRYFHQPNSGMAAARNTGLEKASGDYVVFLDADDRLLPNALEAGVRCMAEQPGCAFVYGQYRMIAGDGSVLGSVEPSCVTENHYSRLLEANYIGMHATVMFDRAALQRNGGFDPRLIACDDYDSYLRMARGGRVRCHAEVVAEYRWHAENTSRKYGVMLDTTIEILRRQRRFVTEAPGYRASYRKGIAHWRALYGDRLLTQVLGQTRSFRQWKSALRGALVLLRCDPTSFGRYIAKRLRARQ